MFHYNAEERIYRIAAQDAAELPPSPDFARDRWEDLISFVPGEPRFSRDACLKEWRDRLDRGEHVYTHVEDGRLANYGWMIERQKIAHLGWTKQTLEMPDDCAVIYDFYTIPEYRNRNFYQQLLMHSLQDAARIPGTRWIYIGVKADDKVPRWWVERTGAEYCESYFYNRVLWREKKWRGHKP
jgi:GNAT superfamily N-acetyltransferase